MKSQFSLIIFLSFVVVGVVAQNVTNKGGKLVKDFYKRSCPRAERLIRDTTWSKVGNDAALAGRLLRMQFHDCFVKGCDASILLDKVGNESPEKEARPNLSLLGFEAIDDIKIQVEKLCPGVVSCADILALSARDAVSYAFRRSMWDVSTGRRDGKTSLASDANENLPSPFGNFTSLQQLFQSKGLDVDDLVALSGAHTIGVSRCGVLSRRLFNFTGNGDMDPSLDPVYGEQLKQLCPLPTNAATTVEMDPQSSLAFDTNYYNILTKNKGLFPSDAALLTDKKSRSIVTQLQTQRAFFKAFASSMLKMGAIEVLTGTNGQIRKNCRVVNP